jgi:urease accessory protein
VGPSAVRITAETFVTPPEFDGLKLAQRSAGQIGGVRLELLPSNVNGRENARLGNCYQQVPLRVLPPFRLDNEPAGLVYLLNPMAGLMDGDGHWLEISTATGAKAVVTGQSATRIHPCPRNFSTQQWRIRVAPHSQLVVLPGPTIPFQGARSYQRVEIDLADDDARLIWAEIWHPGRYDRGALSERFQFHSLIQETKVTRGARLVYRDRFHWEGPWDAETLKWHLGTHLACGSLFVTGPVDEQRVSGTPPVATAVMSLASGDTCIRYLGSPAAVTQAVVKAALSLAARWSANANGTPWLLSSDGLARNHWFSA